jgi:hypothetical protein
VYIQRLALQRDLLQPHVLTSLHDRTAAWLGLGTALNVFRRQSRVQNRTSIVTLYLLCIFGLHISVPALLNVVSMEGTTKTTAIIEWVNPQPVRYVRTFSFRASQRLTW